MSNIYYKHRPNSFKFSLGINDNDETSNEGMHEILKEAHKLVSGHSQEHQMKTFFVGDLKTVERAQNTQLEHRDANTPSKRFEGLIPALADFHTFGNFLAVRNYKIVKNSYILVDDRQFK